MKWYLLIGATVVVFSAILFFVFSGPSKTVTTTSSITGLPIASSTIPDIESVDTFNPSTTVSTLSFPTRSGASLTVKDFIHNGETVSDSQNPGSYVLAGSLGYCLANGSCPSGASTTDFSISYNEKTHFFNIILLKEPLGEARFEAEQFLISRLGIDERQICSLDYFVGAPYWVNETYDDKNLGFSFCSGATKLPK